jgi:AcrR family transcriptional regulator
MVSGRSLTVKGRTTVLGTRDRIVEAAGRVMRERGLARTTTKEIAREAGFSEGTLYKHFDGKEELFLAVLAERLPSFVALSKELPGRAGRETVRQILEEVARTALAFYAEGVPISASVFSEPGLLARHGEELRRRGAGPHRANEAVAAYLSAEQRLGRVRGDADPETAAAMLLGSCFQRAFLRSFLAEEAVPGREERFARGVVDTLMRGLSPGGQE